GKTIAIIKFKGNTKTEDEAIRVNMKTHEGETLDGEKLRDDLRAIWTMGYFEDVRAEALDQGPGKIAITILLKEKPSIRKIYVSGNVEVSLDKINEVLDIKKGQILEAAKIKRNQDKIRDLLVEKGYYLGEVTSDTKRISEKDVDVYFYVDEHAKV